jgi:hypothetical protein
MKRLRHLVSTLPLLLLIASCGGGGDVSADVSTFSVKPSEFVWLANCPEGGVEDAVSIHTVNGGRSPFRIRSQTPGIDVGLVDESNGFVDPAPSMINRGDLVLTGKDPKFALRSTLACGSSLSVLVLDDSSRVVEVNIRVSGTDQ